MPFVAFTLFLIVLIGGAMFVAIRLGRAFELGGQRTQDELTVAKRLQLLEETIERQAAEIDQLGEQQRFLESLLKSRPALPGASDRESHDDTPGG